MMELLHVCDPEQEDCDTLCDGGPCRWNVCASDDDDCNRWAARDEVPVQGRVLRGSGSALPADAVTGSRARRTRSARTPAATARNAGNARAPPPAGPAPTVGVAGARLSAHKGPVRASLRRMPRHDRAAGVVRGGRRAAAALPVRPPERAPVAVGDGLAPAFRPIRSTCAGSSPGVSADSGLTAHPPGDTARTCGAWCGGAAVRSLRDRDGERRRRRMRRRDVVPDARTDRDGDVDAGSDVDPGPTPSAVPNPFTIATGLAPVAPARGRVRRRMSP